MQFKQVVVNNSNQSEWTTVNSLWLVQNAEKLAIVNLSLLIRNDCFYWLILVWIAFS